MPGWVKPTSVKSTLSPPKMVATMRAHDRPCPFFQAIHSHKPTERMPTTTVEAMPTVYAASIVLW